MLTAGKHGQDLANICEDIITNNPNLAEESVDLLETMSFNAAETLRGRGKSYFDAARKYDWTTVLSIFNILQGIGLLDEQEAERIVAILEKEMTLSKKNKLFTEAAILTWKEIAVSYPKPIKKRKHLLVEYKNDPTLRSPAVRTLQTLSQESKTCCLQ